MIGALHKRNSCASILTGEHLSRRMSSSNDSDAQHQTPAVTVKRCHSTSKVEKTKTTPVNIKERVTNGLQKVAQNVCLVQSMIPCMTSVQDSEELIAHMRETNRHLQQVLPALHVFMTMAAPIDKEEKERYQFERKQLSREFEAAILSYRNAQKALNTALKQLKSNQSV